VENGRTVPCLETLEKLARTLEIPTYRLFTADAGIEKPNIPLQDIPGPAANTKQDRELRVFANLLAHSNDKNRGLLLQIASKMAHRA
jgi:hypothetical protein